MECNLPARKTVVDSTRGVIDDKPIGCVERTSGSAASNEQSTPSPRAFAIFLSVETATRELGCSAVQTVREVIPAALASAAWFSNPACSILARIALGFVGTLAIGQLS